MNRRNALSVVLILIASFAFADYVPAPGGEDLVEFRSPGFLSGGASVTSMDGPQSSTLNPAAGALAQRIALDLSYIGLVGLGDPETGWKGHALNLGGWLPTRAGVFGSTLNLMTESLDGLDIGA